MDSLLRSVVPASLSSRAHMPCRPEEVHACVVLPSVIKQGITAWIHTHKPWTQHRYKISVNSQSHHFMQS